MNPNSLTSRKKIASISHGWVKAGRKLNDKKLLTGTVNRWKS